MIDNYYSIKDLEILTGIKAHTLRIWEQRYNILRPQRTFTNIRYYTNEDLKRILNISALNKVGKKISKIATLSDEEIKKEVSLLAERFDNKNDILDSLIVTLIDIDEEKFEKIISNSIIQIGLINTIDTILFPFLNKIGIMWQTGTINPAQEHFISNLIRQKIIVAIDSQKLEENKKSKKIILFLPEGELHEISLLFYNYIVRNNGHKSIYLGQSVPLNDIKKVVEIRKANYLVTVITQPFKDETLNSYLTELSTNFTKQTVLVSGAQIQNQKLPKLKNSTYFNTPTQFIDLVKGF